MIIAARIARQALGRVLDFALPPRCPACLAVTPAPHEFCIDCWTSLDFLGGASCARCGEPLADTAPADALCGRCLIALPPFDRVSAAVAYGEAARRVALRLKHGGRTGLAETVARQMDRLVPAGDWIVAPVPLHRWRIWRRGYNQSALIAGAVARRHGHRHAPDLLRRIRATPFLRGMGPAERARTVRGVFRVPDRSAAKGARILLIDDVYTTGATVRACAKVLKRAGAAEVRVICWARVVLPGG